MTGIAIRIADTPADRKACFRVRVAVFVHEQGVPPEAEIDEHDAPGAATVHLLATADGGLVGAMRWHVLPPGKAKIERVAALTAARGLGIGSAVLHAQTSAQAFCARLGFVPEGETFDEEGIEHIRMRLEPVRIEG